VLSGEATNINFIVFGLIRPGLEPTIYRTITLITLHIAVDFVFLSFCNEPALFRNIQKTFLTCMKCGILTIVHFQVFCMTA